MVAREFIVIHNDSDFHVDYDTDNGFEVSPSNSLLNLYSTHHPPGLSNTLPFPGFQNPALLSHQYSSRWTEGIPRNLFLYVLNSWTWWSIFHFWHFGCAKIIGGDDDLVLSNDSDLISISGKLRLLSLSEEEEKSGANCSFSGEQSDEELARMLQVSRAILWILSNCLIVYLTFGCVFIVRPKRRHWCFSNLLPPITGTKWRREYSLTWSRFSWWF